MSTRDDPNVYRNPKYPNLEMDIRTGKWRIRKYSSLKHKSFYRVIKGIKGRSNVAAAYKKGMGMFNAWLEKEEDSLDDVTIRMLSHKRLARRKKERAARRISARTLEINTTNSGHVVHHFGHLKPKQVTEELWEDFHIKIHAEVMEKHSKQLESGEMTEEQVMQKFPKLFCIRKELVAIMNLGHRLGIVREIPRFRNPDSPSIMHVYIEKRIILQLIRACRGLTKLLAFLMDQMGLRPDEALSILKSSVDFERKLIFIKGKRGRGWNKDRELPVEDYILDEIKKYMDTEGPWLFPSRLDPEKRMAKGGYIDAWRNACRRVGVSVTIYSLRHTFITDRVNADINSFKLADYSGTSAAMLEKRYYKRSVERLRSICRPQDDRNL